MRCAACEVDLAPQVKKCPECGEPVRRPVPQGDDTVATLIPYKNTYALLAYYLGVFGLIPGLGAVLGPAALLLGIMGMSYAKKNPKAHGTGHAIVGIVLGTLELLGHLAVFLLIVVGIMSAR